MPYPVRFAGKWKNPLESAQLIFFSILEKKMKKKRQTRLEYLLESEAIRKGEFSTGLIINQQSSWYEVQAGNAVLRLSPNTKVVTRFAAADLI